MHMSTNPAYGWWGQGAPVSGITHAAPTDAAMHPYSHAPARATRAADPLTYPYPWPGSWKMPVVGAELFEKARRQVATQLIQSETPEAEILRQLLLADPNENQFVRLQRLEPSISPEG
jgi:hypothetical protein